MRENRQRSLIQWLDAYYPYIDGQTQLPQVPQMLAERQREFCSAADFTPAFVAAVCHHGYLPMGERIAGLPILLIKSHHQRCVLEFAHLHVSRKLKRYARGLTCAINHNFTRCLRAIAQHHSSTWLTPPLCETFESLHHSPLNNVTLHSIEIYSGDRLVAGEVGYSTGTIYTSLAGFHQQNGAGSVQLALLGRLLANSGFAFWDLGMVLPYKLQLGAHVVARQPFLSRWLEHRDQPTPDWRAYHLENDAVIDNLKRSKGQPPPS